RAVQQPHGPRVAVRKNRLRSELPREASELFGDRIQRLLPGDSLELAGAFFPGAFLRVQHAPWRILALQILRHFSASKSARRRMMWIAAKLPRAPVFDVDQHRAGIRAIQRAHRAEHFHKGKDTSSEGARGAGARPGWRKETRAVLRGVSAGGAKTQRFLCDL